MNVKEEAEKLAEDLLRELGNESERYQFLISDWEAQDCAMAIRWLKSQIWEGFSVSFEVNKTDKKVCLKSWEEDFD
ncbi:hypothetical protein MWU49_17170 [Alcanivorax sp. S6407]|uniref:hypothetical protein n=1 Tax=Alcanivorax sp. S6407 TaxID=2926424 RepID=UPI001FF322E4|nr:hypothetical protein [Alcanivorax sp. S6407]MCK0155450.1 hypothetical protein [Alcanivorax sp. S6407]